MSSWLSEILDFVRWRDWGPGKIPILCAVLYYVGLANDQVSASFTLDSFLFITYATVHSALGYVINNWGDRELDAAHGKPNAFVSLARSRAMVALATLMLLALLSGLPFLRRPMVLALWAGWAFFAMAYSLRPLRLKARGIWGLGFSFVAQWSLPVLLAFAALNQFGGWDMAVLTAAITISGATLEIAHQRWDRARDSSTNTGTLGNRAGAATLDRLYAAALLMDKVALGAILLTFAIRIPFVTLGSWSLSPVSPLLVFYVVLLAGALYEMTQAAQRGECVDPYYSGGRSVAKLLHETMPNLIVPGYLMALATAYQPINGLLLLTFLLWRLVLGRADWWWPLRAVRTRLSHKR